ncbi:DUF2226 domain-containing protein [Methanothermococcus okinawensis]|uniref:Uncharacterized protein n=1 Tax=Methanothermococcus okinawensis (strain DSM 14208 / JCM 11175 / IH1) TaxID=647113 RepID=F8AKP7_METOI|nr:DUF2226 domain-containing protein [Methanothermococcus okinawensis]AEH06380.1 Protein of unknown function DUF2226 [Methanothermococcus okinawensis IH1]
MSTNIIEGTFVKMGKNCEELTKNLQNFNGYLRLSIKRDYGFEEGYIFLENSMPVGYYYSYNNTELFGNRAIEYIEEMKKNNNCIVELYQYDLDKLKLMKDLFKEMFLNKPEPKVEPKVEEKIFRDMDKDVLCKYQKIVLNIPSGKPLKMGITGGCEEYKEYLEDYRLLDVFKKDSDGKFKRAHIIYHNKEPILAYYEDNNGVLFGNCACDFIKELLNDSDVVIDIYEYNIEKINILTEYYPHSKLKEDSSKDENKNESNGEDLDEFIYKLSEKKEISPTNKDNEEKDNEPLNKEELLKKLGINAPSDDTIDNIIQNVVVPDAYELKNIENEINEKISEFLKNQEDIQDFLIDISVEYNQGYICNCKIKLKPKKKFGLIKKDVNVQYIKDGIYNILNNYIINMDSKVSIELL